MPDSAVVVTMREWKADLLRQERTQMREMARRWLAVERRLDGNLAALAERMAAVQRDGGTITNGMIYGEERYRALISQLTQELDKYSDYAERTIAQRQRQLATLGISHAERAIVGQGVRAGFNRLPIEAVQNMVGLAGNRSPLRSLLVASWPDAVEGLTQALINGVALGYNPRKVAREMARGSARSLDRMMVIARTEQLRTYREANMQSYIASGVVTSYKRLATHDSRVCAACLMDEGHVYELGEEMPEHPQGRCTMVPLVEGVPNPTWKQGEAWFVEQSPTTQTSILGKGRFDAWQAGKFDLGEVVTVRANPTWGPSLQVTSLGQLTGPRVMQTIAPPVPTWSPSMDRATAERWAANSAYKDDVYHVTPGVANERSIKANGFDLSKKKFGRMWGDGVYVGADQETADLYKTWAGRSARTLKIKIDVSNPFIYEPESSNFTQANIIQKALNITRKESLDLWGEARTGKVTRTLDQILSDAGYDALHVKAIPSEVGEYAGGNQLVVFDPKKVVVIND